MGIPRDMSLVDYLMEEASGILNWLLQGFGMWLEEGMGQFADEEYLKPFSNKPLKEGNLQDHHLPFAVVNATRAYFRDMDSLGQFKTEVLDETKNGDDKLEISKVFATYQRWCRGNSLDEKRRQASTDAMWE